MRLAVIGDETRLAVVHGRLHLGIVGHRIIDCADDCALLPHIVNRVPGVGSDLTGHIQRVQAVIAGNICHRVIRAAHGAGIHLAAALHGIARYADLLARHETATGRTDNQHGTDAGVKPFFFLRPDVFVIRQLILGQTGLGQSVRVHGDFFLGEGLAEGVIEHVDHQVIEGQVAVVQHSGEFRLHGAHGVAGNTNPRLIHKLQRPKELNRVQDAAGGAEGIVSFHALIVFVIGRHLAAACAIGVDIEYHKFTAGEFFGNALVIALVDTASVNYDHRRQFVLIAYAGGIVQIAFQLCPAGIDGHLLHLDMPAASGYHLCAEAENQNSCYQNQKQVPAAGFRFEGQPVLLFHFYPFPLLSSFFWMHFSIHPFCVYYIFFRIYRQYI